MVGAGPAIGEPHCFWKQLPLRTTDMGKMCPKVGFSSFVQSVWVFLRKKICSVASHHVGSFRVINVKSLL